MAHNLHLTQEEYAEVLNYRQRVDIDVTLAAFEAYMVRKWGAEYYTENEIHVVRLINRSGDKAPEEYKRYWKWCPRCERFINLWETETWGREDEIERLANQLRSRP